MQFNGKLTESELRDTQRLIRGKMFWLRWIGSHLRAFVIVGGILWLTLAKWSSGDTSHWPAYSAVWIAIAGMIYLSIKIDRRDRRKRLDLVNSRQPEFISFESDGVKMTYRDKTDLHPWSSFKGWREHGSIILVDKREGKSYAMLPVSRLTSSEQDLLRGTLKSQLSSESR